MYDNTATNETDGSGGGVYVFQCKNIILVGGIGSVYGDPYTPSNQGNHGNQARYGGGLYLDNTYDIQLGYSGDNLTLFGNEASTYGGGVYINESSDTYLYKVKVTSNKAEKYGGGLYILGKDFVTTMGPYANIAINSAENRGGGVYIKSGKLTIESANNSGRSASITGNYAQYGGAIYIDKKGKLEMNGGQIYNNTALKTEEASLRYDVDRLKNNPPENARLVYKGYTYNYKFPDGTYREETYTNWYYDDEEGTWKQGATHTYMLANYADGQTKTDPIYAFYDDIYCINKSNPDDALVLNGGKIGVAGQDSYYKRSISVYAPYGFVYKGTEIWGNIWGTCTNKEGGNYTGFDPTWVYGVPSGASSTNKYNVTDYQDTTGKIHSEFINDYRWSYFVFWYQGAKGAQWPGYLDTVQVPIIPPWWYQPVDLSWVTIPLAFWKVRVQRAGNISVEIKNGKAVWDDWTITNWRGKAKGQYYVYYSRKLKGDKANTSYPDSYNYDLKMTKDLWYKEFDLYYSELGYDSTMETDADARNRDISNKVDQYIQSGLDALLGSAGWIGVVISLILDGVDAYKNIFINLTDDIRYNVISRGHIRCFGTRESR